MRRHHPTLAHISHLTAIVLNLAAAILILMVLLYNVPLEQGTGAVEADEIQRRWWLVTVTDNAAARSVSSRPSSYDDDDDDDDDDYEDHHYTVSVPDLPPLIAPTVHAPRGLPTTSPDETTAKPRRRKRPSRDPSAVVQHHTDVNAPAKRESALEARKNTLNTTRIRESANDGVDGRQMYGFGSWGWCEWHRDDPYGDGVCVEKAFWQLPRDARNSDERTTVNGLDLPRSIRKSLSIASFFLIFFAIGTLLTLSILIIAYISPPIQPMESTFSAPLPPKDMAYSDKSHHAMINPCRAFTSVIFTFVWTVPVLAVASIGVGKINSEREWENLDADMGTGVVCLCVAIVLYVFATVIPVFGGLRVRPVRKA